MCGIAGISRPDGRSIDDGDLQAMARAMAHRGPDASGTWRAPGTGLAHTRLSLVDLSHASDQPWTDGHGDALVFNGEIYNFRELRRDLEAKGREVRTTSDTEVLFALIQEVGLDEALRRVRGMFAFAFHERATGTTHLCRDRYGIKPLVYQEHGDGVAFASEVKALAAVAATPVDDVLTLLALRTLGDKSPTRTLFRGLQQVAPGSVVSVRAGRVVGRRSFDPLLDHVDRDRYLALKRGGFDAACGELADALRGSVARMAACDAHLGVFLSGGIDSGLIAAYASREGRDDLCAFTSDVRGPGSELVHAHQVARDFGIPLHASPFDPEHWTNDWVRATWHLETPVITNPSAVPFARVARLAHEHGYKAVLTGEGADELFLGYPRLASGGIERLARAPVSAIRRAYRRVPGLADAVLDERDSRSSAFLRGVAGGFEDAELAAAAAERYDFLPSREAERHAVSALMVQTSLQALLQRNDRMGMAASIESRFPFLDEEVVGLALNLPIDLKLRRSRSVHDPKHPFVVDKAPVRAIASGLLGEEAVNRRKNGFPTPGLHAVRVRRGAFEGGWAADAFGGGRGFADPIADWPQPYDVGKLLSIEIFGRLFGARQPVAEVEAFVRDAVVAA